MARTAKPGLLQAFRNPYWRISTPILIIATISLLSYWAAPERLDAIDGIIPDRPFGVALTDTLISLDRNDDGVIDVDAGDRREVSGYTFTVHSEKVFTSLNVLTVTFPLGIDLVGANETPGNYELYDPKKKKFESATAVTVIPSGAFAGGTIDLTFGGLATPGLLPGIIPGVRGDNITVRIKEGANIGNPRDPGSLRIDVNTNTDTTPFSSSDLFFGSRISLTPNKPGAEAEIKVAFYAKNDMQANVGKITITFDDGFGASGFPQAIPSTSINLQADRIVATVGATGAQPNRLVNPTIPPSFDFVGAQNDLPQLRITIPDMDPTVTERNTGSQGIAEDALVTVTFSTSSAIKLPPEARTPFQFGEFRAHKIIVRTTDVDGIDTGSEEAGDTTEFNLPRVLMLNSDEGSKGDSVSVEGLGFKGGGTVTVFLDKDGDGRFDLQNDSFLASEVADADGTFSTQFVVNESFSTDPELNQVNAIDGEGNSVCQFAIRSPGICDVNTSGDIVRFELKASVSLTPNEGGGALAEFHIIFRDFPGDSTISSITLGGFPVRASDLQSLEGVSLNANGGVTIKALTPRNVPTGPQILRVNVKKDNRIITAETTYTVLGAVVGVSPAIAVPNMNITISGSGFINGAVICASGISIGGEVLTSLPSHTRDGSGFPCSAGEDFVQIGSGLVGPVFVLTVPVPPVKSILDAGIDGRMVQVKVSDVVQVTGIAFLEIPKRELTVSPPFSGTGSLITIQGTGFPADNPDGTPGYNPDVAIRYVADSASRVTNETPDEMGRLVTTMRVPRNALIPSDNAIEATVEDRDGVPSVTTAIHVILGPLIQVEPAAGPSGTSVTILGGGFQPFATVDSVKFGGLGALGVGLTLVTDGEGNLLIPEIMVPGLDMVTVDVVVNVNGVTAVTAFEVTDSGEGRDAPRVQVATGSAPLGNSLERIFYFNNLTKKWTFFDPRAEFANANTLDHLVEGQVYWFRVTEDIQASLNTRIRNLLCSEGDCWSQLVW